MLRHFFLTTFRTLRRQKGYLVVNVLGLGLGILCALIIFLKVTYELGFDTYHPDRERIYRIVGESKDYGEWERDASTPFPMAEAVKRDFPGIEALTIIDQNFFEGLVSIKHSDGTVDWFQEREGLAFTQPDYFRIFHYEWLEGDPETALAAPLNAVISESFAQKYFGDQPPLGRTLELDNTYTLTVTGLVKDVPQNTDVPFNFLVSLPDDRINDNWGSYSSSVQCYLKLAEGQDAASLNALFPDLIRKNRGEEMPEKLRHHLQPLSEIHHDTEAHTYGHRGIAKDTLWALAIIGLVLLLTGAINFINLSTAQVFKRGKEVGLRKVLGSQNSGILLYFLGETALITLLAMILALGATPWVLEKLESLVGEGIVLSLKDPLLWAFLLSSWFLLSLFAGLYPAWLLSRLRPVQALHNTFSRRYGKGLKLRKGLIVLQFAISQALIICTLVMVRQMQHFHSVPLGFDKEALVEIPIFDNTEAKLNRFKEKLQNYAFVKHVSYTNTGTSNGNVWGGNYSLKKGDVLHEGHAHVKFVDEAYLETYGVELLAGEGLIAAPDSVNRFLINETMAHDMGFQDPSEAVGQMLTYWGSMTAPITGVVKDFNTTSLHEKIKPVAICVAPRYYLCGVRVEGGTLSGDLALMEAAWNEVFPERNFEFAFLDEKLEKFYQQEQRATTLFELFAGIAILVGCLGLFGLVSFMAAQRTKEIGVRKVLGATAQDILGLFSREFMTLIGLGFLLAAPLGGYFMQDWLQGFAYRVDLGPWVFAAAIATSLLIALLTIGYRSWKAARTNPVEALRRE